jgi:ABC-type glutathione transport system ATPase component
MSNFAEYKDCTVLCKLNKSKEPLVTKVPIDEFTNEVQNNFDYDFTGESKFYPYELPKEILDLDFNILAIVGASGKGKSTLLKEFEDNREYRFANKQYDNSKAIVSNFSTPRESEDKLNAVGLTSIPVWCRPRNVLSVGEGFRADVALNLNSYTLFDEFTSTIDRNVAKATSNGLQKYIRRNGLDHIVFCSCHKDYIPYLKPDIVIDLDEEKVFDCRGDKVYLEKKNNILDKCELVGEFKI